MKKLALFMSILGVMSMSMLVGCGEKAEPEAPADTSVVEETEAETEAVEETEAETEAEDELEDAVQDLANTLAGTCWVGTDAAKNIYALGFGDEQIAISMVTADGQTDLEGYWGINENVLGVFSDAELTEEVCTFAWDISEKDGTTFIQLDDAVLALTEAGDMENLAEEIAKMNLTNTVIDYIANGTYWFGADDEVALMMMVNGKDSFLGAFGADGSTFTYTGQWGMDYDHIYFMDEETGNVMTYGWNMSEDDSTFSLITENGTELTLGASEVEDIDAALEYLSAYYGEAEADDEADAETDGETEDDVVVEDEADAEEVDE